MITEWSLEVLVEIVGSIEDGAGHPVAIEPRGAEEVELESKAVLVKIELMCGRCAADVVTVGLESKS